MPILEIITLIASGFGAGLVTGLMGASAVIVAAPLLIIVIGIAPYVAVGLSLATDVFASVTATAVYHRNRNVDVKNAILVLLFALVGVVLGSVVSVDFPSVLLGLAMGFGAVISGFSIMFRRDVSDGGIVTGGTGRTLLASTAGFLLGLVAGVFGAGGGVMILLVLMLIFGYRMHVAIGTSVLFMAVIALLGAIVHYVAVPFPISSLALMAVGGIAGAGVSSIVANRLSERVLKRTVGTVVVLLGVTLVVEKLLAL